MLQYWTTERNGRGVKRPSLCPLWPQFTFLHPRLMDPPGGPQLWAANEILWVSVPPKPHHQPEKPFSQISWPSLPPTSWASCHSWQFLLLLSGLGFMGPLLCFPDNPIPLFWKMTALCRHGNAADISHLCDITCEPVNECWREKNQCQEFWQRFPTTPFRDPLGSGEAGST